MIKRAFALACGLTLACVASEAQGLKLPQPSPAQTIKQDFGIGSVELSYSRPAVSGRKVFGDLVPFDKVWRTGANGATTISFTEDVTIGDKLVPAGKYGLLSIPSKDSWTIIISKQVNVNQPALYKQEEDLVRVLVKTMKTPKPVESFTIQFSDITPTSCALQIMWANTAVTLPITTNFDAKVTAQLDQLMKSDKPPYFNAAMYYMNSGKDLKQAEAWFTKATEENAGAFWVWHNKAKCEAKMGKNAEAKVSAQKSLELAKTAGNGDYVALNEKLLATLK
ncbi:MAG: DUF2911 domain-containing protein [Candidatus Pseudobacter hemicellulosilyticus]|uniref:DUF2911 domain-containing protein n=1 Tax=Candidatus Pseudobacter hemicellulosilyticus TaxID=3121375 RepID=A0AAJ6BF12_9BACT|nr:MAG: DUF2911 domain-containing protein [Pseudobacter sp.]